MYLCSSRHFVSLFSHFMFTIYFLGGGAEAEVSCVYELHHAILVSRRQARRTTAVDIWSKTSSSLVQWTIHDSTWIQAHSRLFGNIFLWDVTCYDVTFIFYSDIGYQILFFQICQTFLETLVSFIQRIDFANLIATSMRWQQTVCADTSIHSH